MSSQSSSTAVPSIDWQMVLDSLTLPERIELYRTSPEVFTPDPVRAEEATTTWTSKLGRDEAQSTQDRLVDLGIDESDLPHIFGAIALDAADLIPHERWMDVCAEVRGWTGSLDEAGLPTAPCLMPEEKEEDLPFGHALLPWVDVATRMLVEQCPLVERVLSEKLIRNEQRRLLGNLAGFARFAFGQEFQAVRDKYYHGNDLALGLFMTSNPPQTAYIETVRSLLGIDPQGQGGWMRRFPALARLLGVRVVAWVRALTEFVQRLDEDRSLLEAELNSGEALGELVELAFGSGDSHNGGRSVAICTFDGDRKIVYKPRDGSVDVIFSEVVDHLNDFMEPDLRLRVPRTLDRGNWCWAEFITSSPCAGKDELHMYHLRIGSLLAVIHMLQGNDFHLENVKAYGAFPVAIDLETVCVPDSTTEDPDTISDLAVILASHSVLRTMLLPNVMGFKGANLRSMGAVHVAIDVQNQTRFKKLIQVNTDFQRWVMVTEKPDQERPDSVAWTENDEALAVEEQLAATSEGYESAYRSLYAHQEALLGADSIIRRIAKSWVRVLNRATNVYFRLLYESCQPECLTSGVARWLHLQRLGVIIAPPETDGGAGQVRSVAVNLVEAESEALLEGDIAYFTSPGDGVDHWRIDSETGSPVKIEGTQMKASALECALSQIERMSERDLSMQMNLQGESYAASVQTLSRILHATPETTKENAPFDSSTRPLRELVVEALELIESQAIDSGSHLNWLDLNLGVETEAITPAALDTSLYSGRGGLSLLYERAYRLFGNPRWLEIACGAIDWEAKSPTGGVLKAMETQAPSGMLARSGLMTSAWAVGRHEGHGQYRDLARTLALALSDKALSNDEAYDVIAGSAGYLIVLIDMHSEEAIPGIDDLVGALADHLVANVCDVDGVGWRSIASRMPLCGLGHGLAGIGLALLEAGRFLDRADLRSLGLEALEVEHRRRGDTPEQGWPDYRQLTPLERDQARFGMHAWCAGAEGIALTRAAALEISDAQFLRDDLDFAAESIRSLNSGGRGHICCGQAGRILAHHALRRQHGDLGLSEESLDPKIMAGLLEKSVGKDGSLMGIGMWQGLAGVIWAAMTMIEDDGSNLLLLKHCESRS
ncbi:MAG: hypothetical protein CBC35_00335 [Planctomycetes bacterium TMED75]|nr:hypothetical protein [Planctomycetaceae bacterium]OUU96898.1 MAG: hypothetical protein CBC35_00335 [Planctomycetes bacterium TMED75]